MSVGLVSPSFVRRWENALAAARPSVHGRVTGIVGLSITAAGIRAAIGDVVIVEGRQPTLAEVVALHDESLACMPLGDVSGVAVGALVTPTGGPLTVPVGDALLGRVLDGLGRPIDGKGELRDTIRVGLDATPPHPLRRTRISEQLSLGVRVLDTMTPCGRGQRLGIFAGSGVGKSSLLSMIARGTEADVSVIALVGERGREVREFLENDLGEEGLARSVVVVATSDEPALLRLRAAFVATRIAEWFRDLGRHVILMMDSITRFAMAQREIGLSVGEPAATRGYPPSVFALLPKLLERAGAGEHGSITGLYTVLVEGDDMNEPIADTARSILDGHVTLSRRLATSGHYPAVDVLESISRLTGAITTAQQRDDATFLRRILAAHRDARELIDIGAYVPGSNPDVDTALRLQPRITDFLRQDIRAVTPADQAWRWLHDIVTA
ncbi:type III secretion system ATPase, FliI/YscN [Acidothermus cellulolyticus 11B]|uniref:Type III secretion system ATPase, FliI/YscN n=1 Tax=Acidothermus cellulolyticus (strain ATCC 43068 / DSM 8971 / 11B) TaxID=351607 RepID=A0LT57_ACIC1|nr:FliI/YscN family ATPase [Acidothermus cellulolyticus]ABK52617.1 type III secretion system ATPase, FliI/YscN [Acidothermus cellulolyticus 11B]